MGVLVVYRVSFGSVAGELGVEFEALLQQLMPGSGDVQQTMRAAEGDPVHPDVAWNRERSVQESIRGYQVGLGTGGDSTHAARRRRSSPTRVWRRGRAGT